MVPAENGEKPSGKRMSDSELKALLDAEKMSALASIWSSKLSAERNDALMYYMNDMSKDMPSMDGRSSAVSSDVADTIEGLMPALMEIFAGSEDVVKFNPVGPEDVQAAEQETDYVNHVFMNENPGFLVLYSFIKDALLSKAGIVKVWWEEHEEIEEENYRGLAEDGLAILSQDEDVEIVEQEQDELGLYNVKVRKKKNYAQAKCLGVPPEEFGIEKTARSLRLHECNYCFHRLVISQNRLLEQGYDRESVEALPTYTAITMPEEINRDTVAEHQNVGTEHNPAARRVEIVEHYVRMDYQGDGRAKLYKVTTGGQEGLLMRKNKKVDLEEIDTFPFAAMTPVIMTHRFFGRSIADLVMDIQRVKTALFRAVLDNAYMAVQPRFEIAESHASDNTLDDLLISRPGGLIRTKQPGGLNPIVMPMVAGEVFPLLEYEDSIREMRTGVTKQGQGLDSNALQNQSATAVNQVFTMAQARMKLIARIFAETGIRDLFSLLHGLIRRHGQEAKTVRLRNQWVQIDPRDWKKRNDMTIEVGLGTGGRAEQMALMTMIINFQKEAMMAGLTNLVTPQNLFNSAKSVTRLAGHKDVDAFFTDPSTQPPPQGQPDPKLQIEMLKAQTQAQLQKQKQETDAAHQMMKLQADAQLEQQKFEHEKQLAMIEMGMKREEHQQKMVQASQQMELDKQKVVHQAAIAQQGHEQQMQLSQMTAQHGMAAKEHDSKLKAEQVKTKAPAGDEHISRLQKSVDELHQKLASMPRTTTVHRDPKTGKITGATHEVVQ